MQIQQLEIFMRIYRTKSFAKTAQQMYLSQPRISQQLKGMENELGVTLFERTNHKVVPTDAGHVLYPYAVSMLNFYSEALDLLSDSQNDFYLHIPDPDVHFTSPIGMALNDFAARYTDASFKTLPPVGYQEFTDSRTLIPHHLYLAREEWLKGKDIHFFDLGEATFACMLKPDDELCRKKHILPEDLKNRVVYLPMYNGSRAAVPGPYVWHLRNYLMDNMPEIEIRNEQNVSMVMAKVLSSRQSVGLYANSPYRRGELAVELRPFRVPGSSHIGFAYIGEASEYMKQYMEMAKKRMDEQWRIMWDNEE